MRLKKRDFIGFWLALAGLFVSAQIATSVHVAKFGDAPHDHNGVICALSVAAAGGEKALAAAAFVLTGVVALYRIAPARRPSPVRIAVRRRPRNRAPPAC